MGWFSHDHPMYACLFCLSVPSSGFGVSFSSISPSVPGSTNVVGQLIPSTSPSDEGGMGGEGRRFGTSWSVLSSV
eukprot:scaffold86_cov338-Pavlova_lutheri.AAC.23